MIVTSRRIKTKIVPLIWPVISEGTVSSSSEQQQWAAAGPQPGNFLWSKPLIPTTNTKRQAERQWELNSYCHSIRKLAGAEKTVVPSTDHSNIQEHVCACTKCACVYFIYVLRCKSLRGIVCQSFSLQTCRNHSDPTQSLLSCRVP